MSVKFAQDTFTSNTNMPPPPPQGTPYPSARGFGVQDFSTQNYTQQTYGPQNYTQQSYGPQGPPPPGPNVGGAGAYTQQTFTQQTRGPGIKADLQQALLGGDVDSHGRPRGPVHELAHDLGERLTQDVGKTGYLAAYLKMLHHYPLRTKMLSCGTSAGLQELLASWIANDRNRDGGYFTSRIPKMAVYGAFISAPLGHLMVKIMQNLFAQRTSLRAKILEIIVSNLVVAPIQNAVYLTALAVVAGARTIHQVRATIRAGFMPVMRVTWISSPVALAFAQQFLPEQLWVPFFNVLAFAIGTYVNAHTKKKRITALRRKYQETGGRSSSSVRMDEYGRPVY